MVGLVEKTPSKQERQINLAALKRRDPYISNVIDSATQVAVYKFSHTTEEWVRLVYYC